MRLGTFLKPGRIRWLASLAALVVLVSWLASGWLLEASATTLWGRATLKNGRVELEYSMQPPFPSNIQINTLLPWPTRGECGLRTRRPEDRGLKWWHSAEMTLETTGTITSSSNPPRVSTSSPALLRRIVTLPLWPAVLLWTLLAAWSWRRHLRFRAPGECRRCGYDRRGLAPDAKCPECGAPP